MVHQYESKLVPTEYPVGEHLSKNMPIIDEMARLLKKEYGTRSLNIWCRGSSGAIIAALVGSQYILAGGQVKVCHVKKDGENAHSSGASHNPTATNIMIDDFVSTGNTVMQIWVKQQTYTNGSPMDLLIISGNTSQLHHWAEGKFRKIISQ